MIHLELAALAEARREAFEKEIRLQAQLAQLPQKTARWRKWTGGSLLWLGSSLVGRGEALLARNRDNIGAIS